MLLLQVHRVVLSTAILIAVRRVLIKKLHYLLLVFTMSEQGKNLMTQYWRMRSWNLRFAVDGSSLSLGDVRNGTQSVLTRLLATSAAPRNILEYAEPTFTSRIQHLQHAIVTLVGLRSEFLAHEMALKEGEFSVVGD